MILAQRDGHVTRFLCSVPVQGRVPNVTRFTRAFLWSGQKPSRHSFCVSLQLAAHITQRVTEGWSVFVALCCTFVFYSSSLLLLLPFHSFPFPNRSTDISRSSTLFFRLTISFFSCHWFLYFILLTTSTLFTEGGDSHLPKPLPGENPLVVVHVPVSVWYLEIRGNVVSNLIWWSRLCGGLRGSDHLGEQLPDIQNKLFP